MKRNFVLTLVTVACLGLLLACPGSDTNGGTKYTVTFDKNTTIAGATISETSRKVEEGKAIGALPTGSSSTHEISGWTEGAGAATAKVTAETIVTGDMTVYAQWKPIGSGDGDGEFTSAPIKVGDATQDVAVTASEGAEVTYIENGYKVEISDYGEYAWFKIDLGAGKKLSNFMQVKFNYEAIQGDVGYKVINLLVSDTEFPESLNVDNNYQSMRVSTSYWGKTTGTEAITHTIGELKGENATTYVSDIDTVSSANEIYVCVHIHAAGTGNQGGTGVATTFSVKNIQFVPAPPYLAVSNITGVPNVGEISKEVNLTNASVTPATATNRTIVWSIIDAGTTGVTAITGGKFTPTAKGTIKVKATITNGLTASSDYTKEFEIAIRSVPQEKEIALAIPANTDEGKLAGGYTGTLDADKYGFAVTGGVNYDWSYAVFTLDLGTATLKDVSKVTFTFTPTAGDTGWKDFKLFAAATLPKSGQLSADHLVGTVHYENPEGGIPLEVIIDYTKAATITGNTVEIGFNLHADSGTGNDKTTLTAFTITNIKFWVSE